MKNSLLGAQHESAPVTESDKAMSKRHKAHRKEIDKMEDSPEKFRKSLIYNEKHRNEHQKALIQAKDKLKAIKKRDKSYAKMHK